MVATADAAHVLTSSTDGTVRIWPIAGPGELPADASWLHRLTTVQLDDNDVVATPL
jgi:hypothetical protein